MLRCEWCCQAWMITPTPKLVDRKPICSRCYWELSDKKVAYCFKCTELMARPGEGVCDGFVFYCDTCWSARHMSSNNKLAQVLRERALKSVPTRNAVDTIKRAAEELASGGFMCMYVLELPGAVLSELGKEDFRFTTTQGISKGYMGEPNSVTRIDWGNSM